MKNKKLKPKKKKSPPKTEKEVLDDFWNSEEGKILLSWYYRKNEKEYR